jgi:hypothetical protein
MFLPCSAQNVDVLEPEWGSTNWHAQLQRRMKGGSPLTHEEDNRTGRSGKVHMGSSKSEAATPVSLESQTSVPACRSR